MGSLDNAIDAFFANISPTFRSRVTIMTFSEFGRRPEDNDTSGTDHGTAGVQLLVGDRVGGGLHGAQPSLTALDGNGNLVPQVDFRSRVRHRPRPVAQGRLEAGARLPVPEPRGAVRRRRTRWRTDERAAHSAPSPAPAPHRRVAA